MIINNLVGINNNIASKWLIQHGKTTVVYESHETQIHCARKIIISYNIQAVGKVDYVLTMTALRAAEV
jgi:hypothetical protein